MNQENPEQYYMVVDEKSTGPYTIAELVLHPGFSPEALVWKPGIENWVAAKSLPEFASAFEAQRKQQEFQTPPEYNSPNRPHNQFADNPQYNPEHSYQSRNHNHHRGYGHYQEQYFREDYRPRMRTNWLPWAIVATVLGFFTSCVGAIFGIIGIVQANKANTLYARGYDREGDSANNNAKIMTIIGFVLAGISIIIAFSFGNFFSNFYNLSYL